jgi:hypothetical protein
MLMTAGFVELRTYPFSWHFFHDKKAPKKSIKMQCFNLLNIFQVWSFELNIVTTGFSNLFILIF